MGEQIYIRPLEEKDAQVSFKWRNDPEVWKFTGNRPDKLITYEIELEWIQNVLKREHEKRFAICKKNSNSYIGNIQLTNITAEEAQYHIFIGDKEEWGKGYAQEASLQLIEYARQQLKLKKIYLYVKPENISALTLYRKLGFVQIDNQIRMELIITDGFNHS